MERWHGRVALVTGASAGIGAAICEVLVKHGMKVIGCARNVDKIQSHADELATLSVSTGGTLQAIKCDLRNEDDILEMFKQIREKYKRLDVCVNNAGFTTVCPLLSGKTEDWKAMLDVNVLALCICTREAVKIMHENDIDDGQIIHISSASGHRIAGIGTNFYAGTKFMVQAVTEGLRRELKALTSHIRVCSICPGIVKTEFLYRMHANNAQRATDQYNALECLTAEDIASLVITVLQTPPHVNINDILVRPVEQES